MISRKDWHKINAALGGAIMLLGICSVYFAANTNSNETHAENEGHEKIIVSKGFGHWTYQCADIGHNIPECSLNQFVENNELAGAGVVTKITMIDREGQPTPRLQITTPLDVFLPMGIELIVENIEPFNVPYQYCTEMGCYINLDMAGDVIETLKSSDEIKIRYFHKNEGAQTVIMPLNGFTEAIHTLIDQ